MIKGNQIRINGETLSYNFDFESRLNAGTEWEQELYLFLMQWFSNSEFIQVKTSGSTGTPKTIELSKESMKASALKTCQYFNLNSDSIAHLCLPVKYIAGKMMLVRAIVSGMNLLIEAPSIAPNVMDKIDFSAMTPQQFYNRLKTNGVDSMSSVIIGGGAISHELMEQIKTVSTNCYSTYGMTETATHVAIQPLNGAHASPCYTAIEGVTFDLDERQCLRITAPHLGINQLQTNDIVELISSTSFKLIGRWDNVINSGGVKLFPEVIEATLKETIGTELFVAGIAHKELGEQLVLIVEGEPQHIDVSRLKRLEQPKRIVFISHFVYTESGKIHRDRTLKMAFNA